MKDLSEVEPPAKLRWLGIVPVSALAYLSVSTFFQIGRSHADIFTAMRVDLPMPTRAYLWFLNNGGGYAILATCVAYALLYWRYFSRTYSAMLWANTVAVVACLSMQWMTYTAIFGPVMKIQESLRRK